MAFVYKLFTVIALASSVASENATQKELAKARKEHEAKEALADTQKEYADALKTATGLTDELEAKVAHLKHIEENRTLIADLGHDFLKNAKSSGVPTDEDMKSLKETAETRKEHMKTLGREAKKNLQGLPCTGPRR